MNPAVEVEEVFRVYSGTEDAAALQGLTLSVDEGEILVVLGPSGSGKTTLLRLLAGLDRPSAGRVHVLGRELARLQARELADYRTEVVGYADQHYGRALAGELTARQLIAVPLGLRGTSRRLRLARADELLERVGLEDRGDARPGELSGGERQRIALCAALSHRPRLLLADEPTAQLDSATAETVYRLVRELAHAEGCTVVLVSHDPESGSIADRIVRIRDGRVSEQLGGPAEQSIVVGRGGWLRLPEEQLVRAGIADRARARLEGEAIVLTPLAARRRAERYVPALLPGVRGASVATTLGVHRRFGGSVVLAEVDATFDSGRLTVVTGPSGSGKTTLLHLLAGLDLPSAGEVRVLGTTVSALDRSARAAFRRRHVALVTQEQELVTFLTARENVELVLDVRGRERDTALEALAAVDMTPRADHRLERLSAGERARVAIARALAPRPDLILLDEPTSRLDHANALATAGLLRRVAAQTGAAVVCATHDIPLIEQADDRIDLAPPADQVHLDRIGVACIPA